MMTEQAYINKELKQAAYRRSLSHVHKHLSFRQRLVSKLAHQPLISWLAELAAKTIGRPSGLIGAGLLALSGTTIYYYLTKHYGYNYNFSVFIFLMAVGFVIGLLAELWGYLTSD